MPKNLNGCEREEKKMGIMIGTEWYKHILILTPLACGSILQPSSVVGEEVVYMQVCFSGSFSSRSPTSTDEVHPTKLVLH
jgi:hypothetical protein